MKGLSLDVSSSCTGYSIGTLGQKPEMVGTIKPAGHHKTLADRIVYITNEVIVLCKEHSPEIVVIEKLSHMRSANTVRALAGVIGAITYAIKHHFHMEVNFIDVTRARVVLGVDMSKEGTKKGDDHLKIRSMAKVRSLGIQVSNFDEADAVIMHLAAWKLLKSAPPPPSAAKGHYGQAVSHA